MVFLSVCVLFFIIANHSVFMTTLFCSKSAFAEKTLPFYWDFINVEIDLQENGDLLIEETQQYVFNIPYDRQRYRWIFLDGIGGITDISVTDENGNPFEITTDIRSNKQFIKWTKPIYQPERQTFILRYRVIDSLKIKNDSAILYWRAVFKNRIAPVNKAKVTLKLPTNLAQKVIFYKSTPNTNVEKINQIIEWNYDRPLLAGQELLITAKFPLTTKFLRGTSKLSEENFESNETKKIYAIWLLLFFLLWFLWF